MGRSTGRNADIAGAGTRADQIQLPVSYTHLHRFQGMDKIPEALMLMKDKPADLIKPVVII